MTQPNLTGQTHSPQDWAVCINEAQGWVWIDAAGTGGGGGATYLNDLLDVEIGGGGGPFRDASLPRMELDEKQILKFDGDTGLWKNTNRIEGGTF